LKIYGSNLQYITTDDKPLNSDYGIED